MDNGTQMPSPAPRRRARNRKAEQSRETQDRLVTVARTLFAERGYAGTALEDLVEQAGMTRGALYHQYRDKRDLFLAVFDAVERDLGERVAAAIGTETDPWEALRTGARAFLEACNDLAVRRIVLIDGPSVLGWEEWRRIDGEYSLGMVRLGLEANAAAGNLSGDNIEALTHLIVGALNEAALAVATAPEQAGAHAKYAAALDQILDALRAQAATPQRRQRPGS
jgi:AcrR family transcriptional regulator